jgi:hypothetical protein
VFDILAPIRAKLKKLPEFWLNCSGCADPN